MSPQPHGEEPRTPTAVTQELPEVYRPPEPEHGSSSSAAASEAGSEVANPQAAMELDELRRTKGITVFVFTICCVVIVGVYIVDLDPVADMVQYVGVAVALLGTAYARWRIRDVAAFNPRHVLVFGLSCVVAVSCGFYYYGPVSAVTLVVPIGLYFFALGRSLAVGLALLAAITASHVAISVLLATGVLEERGMIRFHDAGGTKWFVLAVSIDLIFVLTFWMARAMRNSIASTIEQLDRSARAIAQREALLEEAKQELERALRAGGPGRYTGQTLGSFRLGMLLGRGAMGEVYEASKIDSGELAAVKLPALSALGSPALIRRFLREMRVAASLRSDNVVRVLEVPDDESPIPYLAMERLFGETLSDILRRETRLKLSKLVVILRQVGAGLAVAHEAGIVHRDLKPQNLFYHQPPQGKPCWKILDFGVSKLAEQDGTLTRGGIVGTPAYMAPEQAVGDAVDHRADLYSLGIIAYRALTGRPAFSGADAATVLYNVVHGAPLRPSAAPGVPDSVDVLLGVALARDVDRRFQTVDELIGAFEQVARGDVPDELRAASERAMADRPWADSP